MSLFNDFQTRQLQKKANNFIRSLDKLSDKEIEQAHKNVSQNPSPL